MIGAVQIRSATPKDAMGIVTAHVQSWRETYTGVKVGAYWRYVCEFVVHCFSVAASARNCSGLSSRTNSMSA
jgi:hypothetical protein